MTTRQGVDSTIYYDPAKIWERFELRPDQMIDYKALKGDPTDNIPGIPGVGEKTAAKLVGQFGSLEGIYERLAEVKPDKLREKLVEAREQVFAQPRAVADRARPADHARPGGGPALRLRPRRGGAALPRVRVPDADRPAAAADRRVGRRRRPRLCARCRAACRRHGWPGSRPAAAGAAGARGDREQAPLPDRRGRGAAADDGFRVRGTGGACPGRPRRSAAPNAAATPAGWAGGPGRGAARGRRRPDAPGPLRGHGRRRGRGPRWLAGPARGRRGAADGRSTADARPAAGARSGGRRRPRARRRGPRGGRPARRACSSSPGARVVGHETKPLVVANIAGGATRPLPVAFDTQIAAYLLNASLRSQTIADVAHERLDVTLPPAGDVPAAVRIGLDALAALAVREPLEKALAESGLDRLFREIELPLIPVLAEMEVAGVAIDREALAQLDVEFGARDGSPGVRDLRRRRPRVQSRLAQAARADPLLRAEPAQGQADQDRLLDRRVGARGAQAGASDDRQAARLAAVLEAALDLHRGAAGARLRARRPAAHDLPPGRRRHRPPLLVRPEPPEHPDPVGPGAAHPPGVRGRRLRT